MPIQGTKMTTRLDTNEDRRSHRLSAYHRGCGMSTDTLAEQISLRRLHLRRDGQPVTSNQVYAVAMRFPEMFVKDGRLIRLMVQGKYTFAIFFVNLQFNKKVLK